MCTSFADRRNDIIIAMNFDNNGGEWKTEFSFVYSKNNNTVHYCYNSKFDKIAEYKF